MSERELWREWLKINAIVAIPVAIYSAAVTWLWHNT